MSALMRWFLSAKFSFLNPSYRRFAAEFRDFERLSRNHPKRFRSAWKERYPMLDDRTTVTRFDAHYTYHPAWAARIIAEIKPSRHVDVSSSLAFGTILSAFVPVAFYDLRPAELTLSGLECKRGDLTHLPFNDSSIESLSCMHVVEHVGLGRYGDTLDPEGDLKAMAELRRVLARGGSLLFVVPVGKPSLRFNAHRIYSYDQVVGSFGGLQVRQFALIDDRGHFNIDAKAEDANAQEYGCGCWWFVR